MSVDYLELWKEICFQIKRHKYDAEKEFQIVAENIFEKLGWKQYLGEISKPTIPVGASNAMIPDLVINKDNVNAYVVELKRVGVEISDRNIEQLKSYMRQLKLKFGVIIGNSIQIFYESDKDKTALKVCEADFKETNSLGPKIIEQLSKFEYSEEKLENFCIGQLKKKINEADIKNKIDFLCSDAGIKYIKELLSIEYPSEVVDQLIIDVKTNECTCADPDLGPYPKPINPRAPQNIPLEWLRKPSELIQDWIKRVVPKLLSGGYISDNEIRKLHDKQYSKDTFDIAYPLLCDRQAEAIDEKGHYRYWRNWRLQNYYVCSQWWKDSQYIYQEKINAWMSRLYETKNKA